MLSLRSLYLALFLFLSVSGAWAGCKKRKAEVPENERFFNYQPREQLAYAQLPTSFSWRDKGGLNWLTPSWNQHIVRLVSICLNVRT